MTLKTFLQENTVTSFEVADGLAIMNVMVGPTPYGIDVGLSNVPGGTQLTNVDNWTLENDILTVAGLTLNTNDTLMLGSDNDNIPLS